MNPSERLARDRKGPGAEMNQEIPTDRACDIIRHWWVRQSDQPGKTPGTRKIVDKVDVELLLDEIHHEGL